MRVVRSYEEPENVTMVQDIGSLHLLKSSLLPACAQPLSFYPGERDQKFLGEDERERKERGQSLNTRVKWRVTLGVTQL